MISYSPIKTSSSSQTSSMPKPNTDSTAETTYQKTDLPVITTSSFQTSSMPKPNTHLPVSTIYCVEKFYFYTYIEIDQFNSSKELQQIYNKPYNWFTTKNEIDSFRSKCNVSSVLCFAGGSSDYILLAACGNYFAITTIISINSPVYDSGVWWYYTPGQSFGFSPTNIISQTSADSHSEGAEYRLSWHLDQNVGGWRLGSLIGLIDWVKLRSITF